MHHHTVFIVDDDASVRDALALLLSLKGHACSTFASAEDFLAAFRPEWGGCIVADIRMSGMTGLQLQAVLREREVTIPMIIITAHGDVAAARQAFLADAVDFLEKPFDGSELLDAVQMALSTTRTGSDKIVPADTALLASQKATPELSPREQEVMALLVQGLHNRGIAKTLGISHRTVEVHKARVLEKLGVRSVIELVRLTEH